MQVPSPKNESSSEHEDYDSGAEILSLLISKMEQEDKLFANIINTF